MCSLGTLWPGGGDIVPCSCEDRGPGFSVTSLSNSIGIYPLTRKVTMSPGPLVTRYPVGLCAQWAHVLPVSSNPGRIGYSIPGYSNISILGGGGPQSPGREFAEEVTRTPGINFQNNVIHSLIETRPPGTQCKNIKILPNSNI